MNKHNEYKDLTSLLQQHPGMGRVAEELQYRLPRGATVILYGSFVRGEEAEESDIDLWVLLADEFSKRSVASNLSELLAELRMISGRSVAVELDTIPSFRSRVEWLEPWTIELCRTGQAILDKYERWPVLLKTYHTVVESTLDTPQISQQHRENTEALALRALHSTHRMLVDLRLLIGALAAREVVDDSAGKELSVLLETIGRPAYEAKVEDLGLDYLVSWADDVDARVESWGKDENQRSSGEFIKLLRALKD